MRSSIIPSTKSVPLFERGSKLDEVLSEFLNDTSLAKYPMAEHLQKCGSVRRIEGSDKGIECDHNVWWGLTMAQVMERRRNL